jgi:hypothetical protein
MVGRSPYAKAIAADYTPMPQDHWLPGFNFNVEEWFEGDHYETLAICRSLAGAACARRAARNSF